MKLHSCFIVVAAIVITSPVAHGEFIHSNRHVSDAQAKVVEIYYKNGNHTLHDRAYSDALYATLASLKSAMPHMYCVDLSRNIGSLGSRQVSTQASANEKTATHADASYHAAASSVPSMAVANYAQSSSHRPTLPPPFRYTVADDGGFGGGNPSAGNQHHLSSPFRENGQGHAGGDRSDGDSIFGSSGNGGGAGWNGDGGGSDGSGRFGSANAAPEPSSLIMLAIGAAVLGGIGARRANQRRIRATT